MTEPPVICVTGDRLALGPLRRDLVDTVLRWHNDLSAGRNVGFAEPLTVEQDLAHYEIVSNIPASVRFIAYERVNWRPVGRCSLNYIDHRNRTAEFGVLVGDPADRGKGFGTEMTRLMLDYAFTALGLHNVILNVAEFNEAGRRAYERAGFREIGRRRKAIQAGGQYWDQIYMECLSTEFESPFLKQVLVPGDPD